MRLDRRQLARAGILSLFGATEAQAAGSETFGTGPKSSLWTEAPGLNAALQLKSCVYWTERRERSGENDHETAYFRGDAAALNAFLSALASGANRETEVTLRPGAGVAYTLFPVRPLTYDWSVQLQGNATYQFTEQDRTRFLLESHPFMQIHVTPELDLSKLAVPKSIPLLSPEEVKQRALVGLNTRFDFPAWICAFLAELDPYDSRPANALVKYLPEGTPGQLRAIRSLPLFGSAARPVLPELRNHLESPDEAVRLAAQEAVEQIERARPNRAAERAYRAQAERIDAFLDRKR